VEFSVSKGLDVSTEPDPVDVQVGRRVRLRRKELGASQQALADGLGLTFQQVQKYERGTNRISASKLYMMARFLRVSISYFFEGLNDPALPVSNDRVDGRTGVLEQLLAEPNGKQLAEAFLGIRRSSIRKGLVDLAREIAANDQSESDRAAHWTAAE
jgi:transcriptional regulator with XRE-family HTH domain